MEADIRVYYVEVRGREYAVELDIAAPRFGRQGGDRGIEVLEVRDVLSTQILWTCGETNAPGEIAELAVAEAIRCKNAES